MQLACIILLFGDVTAAFAGLAFSCLTEQHRTMHAACVPLRTIQA